MRTITLDDAEFGGTYTVAREEGGRLVLEPVLTSTEEIDERHGLEPASLEALEAEFEELAPSDAEG